MTGLETGLLGGLVTVVMFGAGRLSNYRTVRKETCIATHDALKELIEVRFDNLNEKLDQKFPD